MIVENNIIVISEYFGKILIDIRFATPFLHTPARASNLRYRRYRIATRRDKRSCRMGRGSGQGAGWDIDHEG